ncbi:50S ribosomal protein L4 [Catenisphaera adipataccumulans]|jgi:large subunit ribosomal protein L4|uniref:Large ribosomal subunit protein uL4 n=1 Tax=Catenisphaera adipataccumulans TaxID=700500 RepID=A0A7W8FY11_9FIRM|nr:50S ribosomal protein L4 [Catenisphaera adipataccumulans]MBB5183532.1 large subunit ribosomal protein L4 [Catenisphaera adipataccumulans]
MAKIDVINQTGAVVDSIELNDDVFGIEPHQQAMYDVLVMQAAGKRQGTAKTKTRSEVRGGGRKPYRQKGTGRARQGSIRAPQYRGGGTVFGVVPRDYHYRVNKKIRRLALKSALSEKVAETAFTVVDKFELAQPKTKEFVSIMDAINAPAKTLFVVAEEEDAANAYLSARNIPGTKMLTSKAVNVFDLVNANKVVMTAAAVKEVEEALA